jgi:hypothetical protein
VIRQCRKISPIKFYYVRNIVLPTGRHNIYEKDLTEYEKEAISFNEKLREKIKFISELIKEKSSSFSQKRAMSIYCIYGC